MRCASARMAGAAQFQLGDRPGHHRPRGADRHGPAALIVDPGGDDVYERAPASGGAISVIVDLGGNDRYGGSDFVVRGLSALFDFAGDDRYEMSGPGLAGAVAGASLLVDASGDDSYRAPYFSQGFATFAIAALIDRGGDDRYDINAWGQGSAFTGGLALLWDASGRSLHRTRPARCVRPRRRPERRARRGDGHSHHVAGRCRHPA
jgi:hypothetical protein